MILACSSRDIDGKKVFQIRGRGALGRQQFVDKAFDVDTFVRENYLSYLY